MIVKIPQVSVNGDGVSFDNNSAVFTNLSLKGSIFNQGSASITFFEKESNGGFSNINNFGGKWTVQLDGNSVWQGYVMDVKSTRGQKFMKREVSLVDQTEAWNVLVKDKLYPSTANSSYTVGNLISDLANDAALASGVVTGMVADNSTLLSDVLENGTYVIRSSTYLAEINKVLQWIGYKVYADPYSGKISIIDPNNTGTMGSLDIAFNSDELLNASFDIRYRDIATTVVVGDDVSGKATAYGHLADTPDDKNYDLRKLEKVAFVTTYGVKDTSLPNIAKSVFDLSRKGNQKLVVEFAGYRKQSLLWNALSWVDANGNTGSYKVSDYEISISPQEIKTTVEAVL